MYDELPQLARDDTLRPAICVYSRVYWILVGWIHADLGVSVRCPSRFLRLCPRLSAIVILDVTRTVYKSYKMTPFFATSNFVYAKNYVI